MLQARGSVSSKWPVEELLGVHVLAKDGTRSSKPSPLDYIADFALTGLEALANSRARARCFDVYYVQGVPYSEAIKLLQLKKGTFDWYLSLIRPAVGRRLMQKRLVPGRKFQAMLKKADEEDKLLQGSKSKAKNKRKAK